MYHSATPDLGAAYEQKVMAVWPQQQLTAEVAPRIALAQAWGATLNPARFPPPRRSAGVQILPRTALPGGGPLPPGRGLDFYRAAPIRLAWRHMGG